MINQEIRITIKADYRDVFNYVSDLANDKYWRDEVLLTRLEGKKGVGNLATETSVLSTRVPFYVQQLCCTSFVEDHEITYRTFLSNIRYLQTSRKVVELAHQLTEFSYHLLFSPALVEYGLGFRLPNFIINIITKYTMRKYLKRLKKQLERGDRK